MRGGSTGSNSPARPPTLSPSLLPDAPLLHKRGASDFGWRRPKRKMSPARLPDAALAHVVRGLVRSGHLTRCRHGASSADAFVVANLYVHGAPFAHGGNARDAARLAPACRRPSYSLV